MDDLIGRQMYWNSSFCRCHGHIEVDSELHRFHIHPCDYSHVNWCYQVVQQALCKRISQIKKVWRSEIEEIEKMLVWKFDFPFMRPAEITFKANGLSAYQAYRDWDGRGCGVQNGDLPCFECEEPEILADLVQAKKNREFQIDQWVETYKLRDIYPIWPEEYLSHPGMNEKLFLTLFHRSPCQDVVEALK
jgi:hypothetical protein